MRCERYDIAQELEAAEKTIADLRAELAAEKARVAALEAELSQHKKDRVCGCSSCTLRREFPTLNDAKVVE